MQQTKNLSHLETIFMNPSITKAVVKITKAYKGDWQISLNPEEVRLVQEEYRKEMLETEARTHILVSLFSSHYWDPLKVRSNMVFEGLCSYRYHNNPIIIVEDLSKEHFDILLATDEELTDFVREKYEELNFCRKHNAPVEIQKSFVVDTPYEVVMEVLTENLPFKNVADQLKELESYVIGITSRIKSPGSLVDKITDKITGIDRIYTDKLPNKYDQINDLSGIRIITTSEEACYEVSKYLGSKKGISLVQEPKDYIQSPKNNFYKALHSIIGYSGLSHEIQIMGNTMYDTNTFHPLASHGVYRQRIKEAREELGCEWFNLNKQLKELFKK